MQTAAKACPVHGHESPEVPAKKTGNVHYSMTGGPRGLPVFGPLFEAMGNPVAFLRDNSLRYGDIIPYTIAGLKVIQVNHPALVRYVLMENHKNYHKSDVYLRFESVLGKGLLTSNGDKWKRDRQKIQHMFKREKVEGYYYDIVNEVAENYKKRWLELTENGSAEIDITAEMSDITIDIILRSIFGRGNIDAQTARSLHHSFGVFIDYLKDLRMLPKLDLRQVFRTPAYRRFKKELTSLETILAEMTRKYRTDAILDKNNMLTRLLDAQKEDPEHFTDTDLRDHLATLVFSGYETTSILMQWMWYALDTRPDVVDRLRADMAQQAPCVLGADSMSLTFAQVESLPYLNAVIKETLRLFPPFWGSSRKNVTDDYFGDYFVPKGTTVVLPQIILHHHPDWWEQPNAFVPERFLEGNEEKIEEGLYFPFSHGPRKCIGMKLSEMEAKTVFLKLLPIFDVTAINNVGNHMKFDISLKLDKSLRVRISRR